MKFNLKNQIFYLCPNVAGFLKNVFFNDRSEHIKKDKLKDESFEAAWTRKCAECGSDEEMRWLARHASVNATH